MLRLALAAVAAAALSLVAVAQAASPAVCKKDVIQKKLIKLGKLTENSEKQHQVVDVVRCGDLTDDADDDALFAVASGGTAGDTHFGVLRGTSSGKAGKLLLYKQGYKIGIARISRTKFEVLQPVYKASDPNCCPSAARITPYKWTGKRFKAKKSRKIDVDDIPARFRKPSD